MNPCSQPWHSVLRSTACQENRTKGNPAFSRERRGQDGYFSTIMLHCDNECCICTSESLERLIDPGSEMRKWSACLRAQAGATDSGRSVSEFGVGAQGAGMRTQPPRTAASRVRAGSTGPSRAAVPRARDDASTRHGHCCRDGGGWSPAAASPPRRGHPSTGHPDLRVSPPSALGVGERIEARWRSGNPQRQVANGRRQVMGMSPGSVKAQVHRREPVAPAGIPGRGRSGPGRHSPALPGFRFPRRTRRGRARVREA